MAHDLSIRGEAAANFRLAAPLIAAQIAFIGNGIVDTLMAGRLGERELAAVAVGANIWMQLFVLFMGLGTACSPIVAHRYGGGQAPTLIGNFVRQSLVIALFTGIVWVLTLRVIAMPVIEHLHLSPETAVLAHRYLLAEGWSGLLFGLCFSLRSSAEGLGLTRIALVAGAFGLVAKIIANLCFVHGHLGLPALGVVGLGYATIVSAAVMLLAYVLQYRWVSRLRALDVLRPQWPKLQAESLEVFRLGLPIGLIMFAETAFFGCSALLMARFGDATVAGHQVALNFASLTFMVPIGLGLATTVRVGHAAGAGDAARAALAGRTGMLMGEVFALFSATLMALGAHAIASAYTDSDEVAGYAIVFLHYAALFQLFDCLQATANGALRGIKDTRWPMALTALAYWGVGLPVGYTLAFRTDYGPPGLWMGLVVGLAAASVGLTARFLLRSRLPGAAAKSL